MADKQLANLPNDAGKLSNEDEIDAWRKQVKADLNATLMPGTKEVRQMLENMATDKSISDKYSSGSSVIFERSSKVQDANVTQYDKIYNLYKVRLEQGDPDAPKEFVKAIDDSVANGRFYKHQDLARFLDSEMSSALEDHSTILHAKNLMNSINFSANNLIKKEIALANNSGDYSRVIELVQDTKGNIDWLQANTDNKFIKAIVGEKGPIFDIEAALEETILELSRNGSISIDDYGMAMTVSNSIKDRNKQEYLTTKQNNLINTESKWIMASNSNENIRNFTQELWDLLKGMADYIRDNDPNLIENIAKEGKDYETAKLNYEEGKNKRFLAYMDRQEVLKKDFEENLMNVYKYMYSSSDSEGEAINKSEMIKMINKTVATKAYGKDYGILEFEYGLDFDEDIKAYSLGLVLDETGSAGNMEAYNRKYFADIFMKDIPGYTGTFEEYMDDKSLEKFRPSDDAFANYVAPFLREKEYPPPSKDLSKTFIQAPVIEPMTLEKAYNEVKGPIEGPAERGDILLDIDPAWIKETLIEQKINKILQQKLKDVTKNPIQEAYEKYIGQFPNKTKDEPDLSYNEFKEVYEAQEGSEESLNEFKEVYEAQEGSEESLKNLPTKSSVSGLHDINLEMLKKQHSAIFGKSFDIISELDLDEVFAIEEIPLEAFSNLTKEYRDKLKKESITISGVYNPSSFNLLEKEKIKWRRAYDRELVVPLKKIKTMIKKFKEGKGNTKGSQKVKIVKKYNKLVNTVKKYRKRINK